VEAGVGGLDRDELMYALLSKLTSRRPSNARDNSFTEFARLSAHCFIKAAQAEGGYRWDDALEAYQECVKVHTHYRLSSAFEEEAYEEFVHWHEYGLSLNALSFHGAVAAIMAGRPSCALSLLQDLHVRSTGSAWQRVEAAIDDDDDADVPMLARVELRALLLKVDDAEALDVHDFTVADADSDEAE